MLLHARSQWASQGMRLDCNHGDDNRNPSIPDDQHRPQWYLHGVGVKENDIADGEERVECDEEKI